MKAFPGFCALPQFGSPFYRLTCVSPLNLLSPLQVCFVQGAEYVIDRKTVVAPEPIDIPSAGPNSKSSKEYRSDQASIGGTKAIVP
jgi:hypothetical protein